MIGGGHARRLLVDELAVEPDLQEASATCSRSRTEPPAASSRRAALCIVSRHSSAGSESATTAPPTCRCRRPRAATKVRIATDRSMSPPGCEAADRAAVGPAPDRLELLDDLERADLGRARDRSGRERGAHDLRDRHPRPQPRLDARTRGGARPGWRLERAELPLPRRCRSAPPGPGRCAPGRRSSRSPRGPWRSSAARAPGAGPRRARSPRGRVPLIGRVSIRSPRRLRNRSGEAEITSAPPSRTSAMNGAGLVTPQPSVERERIAGPIGAEALREVDLEDVAGADVVDRAADRLLVPGPRERALPAGQRLVHAARRERGAPAHAAGARRRRRRASGRCGRRDPTPARPRSGRAPAAAGRGRRPPGQELARSHGRGHRRASLPTTPRRAARRRACRRSRPRRAARRDRTGDPAAARACSRAARGRARAEGPVRRRRVPPTAGTSPVMVNGGRASSPPRSARPRTAPAPPPPAPRGAAARPAPPRPGPRS